MAGVLRTPRTVPLLNPQAMKVAQTVALNDEVAQILKGLKLDRQFFMERIRPEALQELAPVMPPTDVLPDPNAITPQNGRQMQRESIRRNRRKMTLMKSVPRNTDFDIYVNEAVMPVLAQALDALCRQLARMKEQGDHLDPKVRSRFNPLTWLGQQLLRRHPKCARTPRRQLLYRGFKDWADWEKGRREMLRKKEAVNEVFNGFMLRGAVAYETVGDVVRAVDDSLCLEGVLKNSGELHAAMRGQGVEVPPNGTAGTTRFAPGVGWTFDEFWYYFGMTIMKHDIVPYSLLLRGSDRRNKERREAMEFDVKQQEADAERQREEDEKRVMIQEYASLYEKLANDEHILSILNDGKILTGDDVRQGDIGYELEVPPHGNHIQFLGEFLVLLGLESAKPKEPDSDQPTAQVNIGHGLLRASAKAHHIEGAQEAERYWDTGLAHAWGTLQKVHHAEMCDGVIDADILRQVLVPPVGFNMLKAKVEYELERKRERGDESDDEPDSARLGLHTGGAKPTMEQLAQRLGMTMARLEWLHKLFESFLSPDPDDPNAPAPCCLYPECPASLNKDQMKALVGEVEPNLSKDQFDARFKRLDSDGSGLIEFDEFAHWVHSSDVRIAGNSAIKMTFEEIAYRYQEPVELIKYIHSCFVDQLPEGVTDNYPTEPAGLAKQEAKFLAGIITPGFDKEEFDQNFAIVNSRQSDNCDFDEFVELLELDDLPAELRDRFEEN